jgi:broad specificity phosphatase PhoE
MNTALTDLEVHDDDSMTVTRYADAGHLGGFVGFAQRMHADGSVVIDLIRHGVTDANENGRVQGQLDWGLNERGRGQAASLGRWIGAVDAVYSSPLGRAAETATLAFGAEHDPHHHGGLMEINMGNWEGRDWSEIRDRHPDLRHLYDIDEEFQRGQGGETYRQLRERATAAVGELANGAAGPRRVAVVSHGGTIGAYIRELLGLSGPARRRIGHPINTSASRVVFTPEGPLLADFNVSYHLE